MRRSTLLMCALLLTATFGCDKVQKQVASVNATIKEKVALARQRFFGKKPAPSPAAPAPAQPAPGKATPNAAAPTRAAPSAQPSPSPTPPPPPQQLSGPGGARPLRDVPYVSEDTGTIAPGMNEKEVFSLWGAPAAVRHLGEFTYIFFQNGCEYSCGTMDVVTLKNGQVVDAIVRWPGHSYSGQSTSPTGAEAGSPNGEGVLEIAPDTTQPQPSTP